MDTALTKTSDAFNYSVKILEHHLDTFGHVNNAKYLEIFEEARWELISQNGFGLEDVHRIKMGPIILGIEIQFKKEIKNREIITITTQCTSYEGKIAKLTQKMIKRNGEEACEATFTFGLFDFKTRKLISPMAEWLKAIGLSE
jgi:YbgC/YbaW family acyl-CoA thioester hydrolase